MFIYFCDKCKAFECFVEADEEWKCKECGNTLLPLGVTIDEWNALSEADMLKTINYARDEAERKAYKAEFPEQMEDPNKNVLDVRVNLMECPKCLKMISPNSAKCPHCDYFFVNNPAAVKQRNADKKAGIIMLIIAAICVIAFVLYSCFVSGKFIVTLISEALDGDYTGIDYIKGFGIYALLIAAIVLVIIGVIKLLHSRVPESEEVFYDDVEYVSEVIHGDEISSEAKMDNVIKALNDETSEENTDSDIKFTMDESPVYRRKRIVIDLSKDNTYAKEENQIEEQAEDLTEDQVEKEDVSVSAMNSDVATKSSSEIENSDSEVDNTNAIGVTDENTATDNDVVMSTVESEIVEPAADEVTSEKSEIVDGETEEPNESGSTVDVLDDGDIDSKEE